MSFSNSDIQGVDNKSEASNGSEDEDEDGAEKVSSDLYHELF
jgi:hypothetical protein